MGEGYGESVSMASKQDMLSENQRRQNNKLADYLGWNMTMSELLELWEKTDSDFLSADELGIADYMVYVLGTEKILNVLAAPLVEKLVSENQRERQDAINEMRKMGYDMTKLGYKR